MRRALCEFVGCAQSARGRCLHRRAVLAEVGAAQAMPGRSTVAVCFSGWQGRAVPDGGESIRRYLVRPLKADVLLALRLVKQVGRRTTT